MAKERKDYLVQIAELTVQIDALPKGYISKKTIGDTVYFYHQWSENGAKKSRYIPDRELSALSGQIEERKQLQQRLKAVKAKMAGLNTGLNAKNSSVRSYTLMHKHIPVAELLFEDNTGLITKITAIYHSEHLPLGVRIKKGTVDKKDLNEWWRDRSIPGSRSGISEAMETLGITDTKALLVKCYGLSLSDQYWICPNGSKLSWENLNYFTNSFSDDIGDVLFGSHRKNDPLDFSSPDNTSDGNLKKRWKIINGKRCLIKGGSNPYRQQPFNEVIATEIMKRLHIPYVPYTVTWNKNAPYSICEDFIDDKTELIPAWRIIKTQKQPDSASLYQHFVACAQTLGIPDVEHFLDQMIVLDYIIANEDRHFNNFGAVRNAETLEWIGMAPIYDSGSSLGYDKLPAMMQDRNEVICKPFKKYHDEQLKLVKSFDWIDFSALEDVKDIIIRTFSDERARTFISDDRAKAIAELTMRRIRHLKAVAKAGSNTEHVQSRAEDVEENIAAEYN